MVKIVSLDIGTSQELEDAAPIRPITVELIDQGMEVTLEGWVTITKAQKPKMEDATMTIGEIK